MKKFLLTLAATFFVLQGCKARNESFSDLRTTLPKQSQTTENMVKKQYSEDDAGESMGFALGGSTPRAPRTVTLTPAGSTVQVSWSSVPGASGYNIYRGLSANNLTKVGSANRPPVTSSNLVLATTYYFAVAAYNKNGEGPKSDVKSATTKPNAPTNLRSTSLNNNVLLEWDTTAAATSYKAYYGSTTTLTLGGTVTSPTEFLFKNLTAGKKYFFKVTGVNAAGESVRSVQHEVVAGPVIPAPLTGNVVDRTINLSWSPSPNTNRYRIYRKQLPSGTESRIAEVTTTTYADIDLKAQTQFQYRVTTMLGSGEVTYSETKTFKALGVIPPDPVTATAEQKSDSMKINWTASAKAVRYVIQRRTNSVPYAQVAEVLPPLKTYSDTTIVRGVRYYYQVVVYAADGGYSKSNEVTGVPGISGDYDVKFRLTANCSGNESIAAVNKNSNCQDVSDATEGTVKGILVGGPENRCIAVPNYSVLQACKLFKAGTDSDGSELYSGGNCTLSTFKAFVNQESNCDDLEAITGALTIASNSYVDTSYCENRNFASMKDACREMRTRPAYLSVSFQSSGSILATWTGVPNLTKSELYRQVGNNPYTLIAVIDGSGHSFTDTQVSANFLYQYFVRTTVSNGDVKNSGTVSISYNSGGGNTENNSLMYQETNCTGNPIVSLTNLTNCSQLDSALTGTNIAAIKLNGTCYNLSNVSNRGICERYKGGGSATNTLVFDNDWCNGTPEAAINSQSDCSGTANYVYDNAAGIRRSNESCININDRNFESACYAYKSPPTGGGGGSVEVALFNNDACAQNSFMAYIDDSTSCSDLSNQLSSTVRGVRIGGTCYDVDDVSVYGGCNLFKAASRSDGVKLFNTDNCTNIDILGATGPNTDCNLLGSYESETIRGISGQSGECNNVTDRNFVDGCNTYRNNSESGVALYYSDSCNSSNLIGFVTPETNCTDWSNNSTGSVWGVRVNGTCYDVPDTDRQYGCERYKYGADYGAVAFYHSDSCNNSDLLAFASPRTNCDVTNSFVSSQVWGVKQGSSCEDISDAYFNTACPRYQNGTGGDGGVAIYYSDSCSGSLIGGISENTNCQNFANSNFGSTWGVKIQGQCYDVSDTTVLNGCELYKAASDPAHGKLFRSDSCSTDLKAAINRNSNCSDIGSRVNGYIYGIQKYSDCYDISDRDAGSACDRFKLGIFQ